MEKTRKKKEKKGIPFIKKRFEYVLKMHFYTKSKFASLLFPDNADPLRKLQKYMESEKIPREILEEIAKRLDVSPNYLKGDHTSSFQNDAFIYGENKIINSKLFYDEEGNYIPTYEEYLIDQNIFDEKEQLISILNKTAWCYWKGETEHDIKIKQFDFHRLDHFELIHLLDQLGLLVEQLIMNPNNPDVKLEPYNPKCWETFVSDSLNEEERKLYKNHIANNNKVEN